MDIFKFIGVGLIAAVAAALVKPQKPEIAIQITLAACILIVIAVADELAKALGIFNTIAQKLGPDSVYIGVVLKVTGIAYAAEFASNVCKDAGETAIATKIDLAGKVLIFVMCAPLLQALVEIISSLV